ncbi:hypothetical protein [Streptomyces sp. C36]|uniref:hypothetical protein n=1 Tax=Streptomyces sp. C36 TaxID=3237122 RepID=UPI0034C6D2ED
MIATAEEAGRQVVGGLMLDRVAPDDRLAHWRLVEAAGGRWRLVYLPVDRGELLRRLADRNQRADANALIVTAAALDDFFARFEPPAPHEQAITHAGDPAATCAAVLDAEREPEQDGRPGIR